MYGSHNITRIYVGDSCIKFCIYVFNNSAGILVKNNAIADVNREPTTGYKSRPTIASCPRRNFDAKLVTSKETPPAINPFTTAPITPDDPRSAITPPAKPATNAVLPRIENAMKAESMGNNNVPTLYPILSRKNPIWVP